MKVTHTKLDNGKTLRATTVDMAAVIEEKLANAKVLETHKAQIDVYKKSNSEVVDRKILGYHDAIAYGKEIKKEFPELGYRVIQIVE